MLLSSKGCREVSAERGAVLQYLDGVEGSGRQIESADRRLRICDVGGVPMAEMLSASRSAARR